MRRYVWITGIPVFLGMLVLILDSRCALESSTEALLLCTATVIPSLFPFLFFSGLITRTFWGNPGRIMRLAGKVLNIPSGAESIVVPGFLGGYPAGAQAIGNAFRTGRLERQDAQKMLSFCNNAGPAFLFGMVGPMFPEKWMVWHLWIIHMISAALTGVFYSFSEKSHVFLPEKRMSLSENLTDTIKIMGIICGWIILFRIGIGYLDRWFLWIFPETVQTVIWGFLELSNGCCALSQIDSIPVRFVVCSAMLSFGGVCVAMQTASVSQGLSTLYFLRGKFIQTAISICLALCTIQGYGNAAVLAAISFLILWKNLKKEVAFRKFSVYNGTK